MENIVPGTLQRLRAADIIQMAGLTAASLGQEYCRMGAVRSTERQGARISGVVDVPHAPSTSVADSGDAIDRALPTEAKQRHFPVEVEMQSLTSWISTCPCKANAPLLCVHGAALLYQWLGHPAAFISVAPPSSPMASTRSATGTSIAKGPAPMRDINVSKPARPVSTISSLAHQRTPTPVGDIAGILTQSGLSELRSIAREYEITANGMTKQQLADAIVDALKQPEAVRRVATTLEKPQRQLLAALALAGGSMTDDDLRGLFERFSLGLPNQLQRVLVTLQGKALLFRTSLNSASPHSLGLSGTLLDVGWYVPAEVRTALRASVPVTIFDVEQEGEKQVTLSLAEPYRLLSDLLLIARALDGHRLGSDDEWREVVPPAHTPDSIPLPRSSSFLSTDGSVPISAPDDMPSTQILSALQEIVPHSAAFLRFAVRLLRLTDIVYKNESGAASLHMLPGIPRLLLGSTQAEVLRDFFELWLEKSSYGELFALEDEGLHLRCRATSLNLPILRSGELDAENKEARQTITALLAQAPLNQWISFPAFARFVYRLNPLFLQRRQRLFPTPHWWLEQNKGHPLRPLHLNDWLHGEMYYLSYLLTGPFHWWGACDLARSRDGRLQAFRLTPLAGWLCNNIHVPEKANEQNYPLASASLSIMDTKEILVTCSSHAWPVIDVLETFAEAAGARYDSLCYHLTPKALGDALSHGHCPKYLLELLHTVTAQGDQHDSPLSQMVSQLEQWIASYGRVRIYSGVTLLETTDTVVMRELSATTSLDEQIVQTIHPTLHILKKDATGRMIDDLKRRGQSPLLHDEEFYGPE